jgi:hypothetical protein
VKILAALAALLTTSVVARAEIVVLECDFATLNMFITIYDDGTPARIGTKPGVGNRASVNRDPRNGAWIAVEVNIDNVPITFTTVQPNMQALHSRHVLGLRGEVVAPSHTGGKCKRVAL